MIWAGIAAVVMLITGAGDDTLAFRKMVAAYRSAIMEVVTDPAKQEQALRGLEKGVDDFEARRRLLTEISKCIEDVDRNYHANGSDYDACRKGRTQRWDTFLRQYLESRRLMKGAMTSEQWERALDLTSKKAD